MTRRISPVAVCCSSASASRSSRSRTLALSLFGDLGAVGRLDSTFPFVGFAPRRIGVSSLLRRVAIVRGGYDRLCERACLSKFGGRAGPTGAGFAGQRILTA